MTKRIKMIDPDSGWKYGFPKEIPDTVRDVNLWLVENGYPRNLIKRFEEGLGYVPYRMWWSEQEQ